MAVNTLPLRQNETVFEAQVESIATGGAASRVLTAAPSSFPKRPPETPSASES